MESTWWTPRYWIELSWHPLLWRQRCFQILFLIESCMQWSFHRKDFRWKLDKGTIFLEWDSTWTGWGIILLVNWPMTLIHTVGNVVVHETAKLVMHVKLVHPGCIIEKGVGLKSYTVMWSTRVKKHFVISDNVICVWFLSTLCYLHCWSDRLAL